MGFGICYNFVAARVNWPRLRFLSLSEMLNSRILVSVDLVIPAGEAVVSSNSSNLFHLDKFDFDDLSVSAIFVAPFFVFDFFGFCVMVCLLECLFCVLT